MKTPQEALFGASGLTAIAGSIVTIGLKISGVDITEWADPATVIWRHDTMTWAEVSLHVTSLGALLGWLKGRIEKSRKEEEKVVEETP